MLSTFLSSLRGPNLNIYSSPSRQPVLPQSIKLPDLFGAIPNAEADFRVNELCRDVKDETDAWLRGIFQKESSGMQQGSRGHEEFPEAWREVSEKWKPALLAACLFPGAGRIQLRVCSDVLACLMIMEMEVREDHACGVEDTSEDGSSAVTSRARQKTLRRALEESLLGRIRKSRQAKRTFASLEDSISLLLLPDEERRISSADIRRLWQTLPISLTEYALDMDSTDPAARQLGQSPLTDMRDAVSDIIMQASTAYEIAGKFCYARRQAHTLSKETMQKMWEDQEKLYEQSTDQCLESLRTFTTHQQRTHASPRDDFTIRGMYARALGHYVRGYLQWCFESTYFFGDEGERIRVTLKVPIDGEEDAQTPNDGEETLAVPVPNPT